MNRPVLLVCSCINVFAPSKITDISLRKKHYLHALRSFIEKSMIQRIIVVENTDTRWVTSELSALALEKGKSLEELTFKGDVEMATKHSIGYSHFEMVHHAFLHSKILNIDDSLLIMDGRYEIRNIDTIYQHLENNRSAFIPEIHRFKKNNLCDMRLYMVSRKVFMDYIWPIRTQMAYSRDGWAETILDKILREKQFPFDSLVTLPRVVGVQGSTGAEWDGNNFFKYWFKKTVISLMGILKY